MNCCEANPNTSDFSGEKGYFELNCKYDEYRCEFFIRGEHIHTDIFADKILKEYGDKISEGLTALELASFLQDNQGSFKQRFRHLQNIIKKLLTIDLEGKVFNFERKGQGEDVYGISLPDGTELYKGIKTKEDEIGYKIALGDNAVKLDIESYQWLIRTIYEHPVRGIDDLIEIYRVHVKNENNNLNPEDLEAKDHFIKDIKRLSRMEEIKRKSENPIDYNFTEWEEKDKRTIFSHSLDDGTTLKKGFFCENNLIVAEFQTMVYEDKNIDINGRTFEKIVEGLNEGNVFDKFDVVDTIENFQEELINNGHGLLDNKVIKGNAKSLENINRAALEALDEKDDETYFLVH